MGQPTQISEKELIEGCIRQERGMLRLLFDRFAGKMMTVCRRYTRNKMEAEDLLQDGFIKAFTRLEQHNQGSLEGWLRRIFVNTCLNHWRDTKKLRLLLIWRTSSLPTRKKTACKSCRLPSSYS